MDQIPEIPEHTVSSNDALTIVVGEHEFGPTFTYPIFGEHELLSGYDKPRLRLSFDPRSLLPLLEFEYKYKAPDASDPVKTLREFLSEDTYYDREAWSSSASSEFSPPGELFAEVDQYKIYKTTISEARTLLHRMRIFVLLYIEAGSYIDELDDRWELYVVYSGGNFAAFATVYPYFYYTSGSDFPQEHYMRKRISQFVVLPPYQKKGLGKMLYQALYRDFLNDPRVRQVTVEDPNERFDDLRDRCDFELISQAETDLELPVSDEHIAGLGKRYKMVPRQVRRCIEMVLLLKERGEDGGTESKAYKRFVKERLYAKNFEFLEDKDPATQREMLDQTYTQVVDDYERLVKNMSKKRQKVN